MKSKISHKMSKPKMIKINLNKLINNFLKDCLRLNMSVLAINVSKCKNTANLKSLSKLFLSASDATVMFKASLDVSLISTDKLIDSLKSVAMFAKDVLDTAPTILDKCEISDEKQFEFYKIGINAERLCEILRENDEISNSHVMLNENHTFIRSIKSMDVMDLDQYFIDINEMLYDPEAELVHIKYLMGHEFFEACFKIVMSSVSAEINMLNDPTYEKYEILLETSDYLCALYSLRLSYKHDSPDKIVSMFKFVIKYIDNLILMFGTNSRVFKPQDIVDFKKTKSQCKLLMKSLSHPKFDIDDKGYILIDPNINKALKSQFDEI